MRLFVQLVKATRIRSERGALFSKLSGFGKGSAFSLTEADAAPSPKSIADELYARNSASPSSVEVANEKKAATGALSRMLGGSLKPTSAMNSSPSNQPVKKQTSGSLTRVLGGNQSPLSGALSKPTSDAQTTGALSRMLLSGSQNPLNDGTGSHRTARSAVRRVAVAVSLRIDLLAVAVAAGAWAAN